MCHKCVTMNYEFKHLKSFYQVDARVGISFFFNGKRYRYFCAKILELDLQPNQFDYPEKEQKLNELLNIFRKKLEKGWRPTIAIKNAAEVKIENISLEHAVQQALKQKLSIKYSSYYERDLKKATSCISNFVKNQKYRNLKLSELDIALARELLRFTSESSRVQFNFKIVYSALLGEMFEYYKLSNPFKSIKLKKQEEVLHKPIKEIKEVLEEIYHFNTNLHLCCLIAYGCLLRPHREIRNLKWSDFSEDCSYISLSGAQNKGKKNRIVPVPMYVRNYLVKGNASHNIFTGEHEAYNEDYFKTLWSKYKKRSTLLNKDNTLYSFRHTGAINVFEKTGSLIKLQQVMGHSNLNVSLTYLRGLEVKQLVEEDMPEL
jgi:integrase